MAPRLIHFSAPYRPLPELRRHDQTKGEVLMPTWLKHNWYSIYWGGKYRPGFFTPGSFSGVNNTSAQRYIANLVAYLDAHQYSVVGVIPIVEPVQWEEKGTGLSLHCTTGFYSILERREQIDEETYSKRMGLVYLSEEIEAAKQYIKNAPQQLDEIDITAIHEMTGVKSLSEIFTLMSQELSVEERKGLFKQTYVIDIASIITYGAYLTFKTPEEAEEALAGIRKLGAAVMQQYRDIVQRYGECAAFLKTAGIPDEEIPPLKGRLENT